MNNLHRELAPISIPHGQIEEETFANPQALTCRTASRLSQGAAGTSLSAADRSPADNHRPGEWHRCAGSAS